MNAIIRPIKKKSTEDLLKQQQDAMERQLQKDEYDARMDSSK